MTGRRERKKAQTRLALLQALVAALDVYPGRRLDDVSIDEIAESADVSARTFFRYFDTKDDAALAACGLDPDVGAMSLDDDDPELVLDRIDARLLDRLVRGDDRFVGVAFVRLSGGKRERFAAAGALLDEVLNPERVWLAAATS